MPRNVIVIGAGISGLSSACFLAKGGMKVTVLEKNGQAGGRASRLEEQGFCFDMGPSWYWMPDVFERFFSSFGKSVSDHYELKRLDPSYAVFYGANDVLHLPASLQGLHALFESIEKGSSKKLDRFLKEAQFKYTLGMGKLVYKPGLSITEFLNLRLLKEMWRMHLLRSFSRHVRSYFKSPRLVQLLEFPVLFLGAMPSRIPALYSLMNYADMKLGTWYPMGGMYRVVEAMKQVADSLGVEFMFNTPAEKIETAGKQVAGVVAGAQRLKTGIVVSGADYHHTEQALLGKEQRVYSEQYWESRELAPSCLIFYVGINKKIKALEHHNLFFDEDLSTHLEELFITRKWPGAPLFYVSCTSKTDPSAAPSGHENLFILIPVSAGLQDDPALRERYFDMVMSRMEKLTGESIRAHIVYKRSYAHSEFMSDYNAYRGNAYGLANTLRQTSMLRPSVKSKKVNGLYFTGQFTVPGPGVPPAIISGQVTAGRVLQECSIYEGSI
jgi:phytoene desaturase